jgi:hypothetical protein
LLVACNAVRHLVACNAARHLVACNAARHLVGQVVPGRTHSRIRCAPALRGSKTVGV